MWKITHFFDIILLDKFEFGQEVIGMEYMGDEAYWNHKFKNRLDEFLQPEKLLLQDIDLFRFGKFGLDLACGDGRNMIPLAQRGHMMTGLDFSEKAIERLRRFSKEQMVHVETFQADLSKRVFLENLPKFDFIIINHYRMCPDFYLDLIEHLNDGGYLWVNGFAALPISNPDITEKDLLSKKDFEHIQYMLLDKKEYENGDRKFIRYCFRK